jgi:hypothetical protein
MVQRQVWMCRRSLPSRDPCDQARPGAENDADAAFPDGARPFESYRFREGV